MDETVRVGMLGCGQIAAVHAERLRRDPRAQCVAVYDPRAEAAQKMVHQWADGIRSPCDRPAVCRSAEEVFDQPGLDAVVICTPTSRHFEQAEAALNRGLHILCEKPLADTRARIVELVRRAERSGRVFMVAYQRRFQAVYRTMRREVASGRYGRVVAVASHNSERWQQLQALPGTWRDDPTQNRGGYLGDAGSHKVDAVFFVTGLAAESAAAVGSGNGARVPMITQIAARLQGGVPLGMTFVGAAHVFLEKLHVCMEGGDLYLDQSKLFLARENRVEPVTDLEPESDPVAGFIDGIVARAENFAPPHGALAVYDFTEAVLTAAENGVAVDVGPTA